MLVILYLFTLNKPLNNTDDVKNLWERTNGNNCYLLGLTKLDTVLKFLNALIYYIFTTVLW